MTIDDKIRDKKLQYDINREAAKISALSSGKIEYLTGEEIVPFNQRHITEQAKFAYSPLEIVPFNQRQITEQAKFCIFSPRKSF